MVGWIVGICAFFITIQLVCCFAFKRIYLKLLPEYLLVLLWLYCLVEYIGMGFDKGPWSGLWALILAILLAFASAATLMTWLVYAVIKYILKRKNEAACKNK